MGRQHGSVDRTLSGAPAAPVVERRIGFRRSVLGVEMLLPPPPARFGRRRPQPVVARLLDLSVSGAGLLAPTLDALQINATVPVELHGETGKVKVRTVRPTDQPGRTRYGVQFVGTALDEVVVRLLDVPDGFGSLANSLVGLLDDLAGHLDNAAGWGAPDPDLKRVAADLAHVVSQFEVGRVSAEDILCSVCWIESPAATDAELQPIRRWAQDVNVEISRHPFAARQDLARTLCALATDSATSPLGAQVMRTLAESLLL